MTHREWQIESKRATSHLSYGLHPTRCIAPAVSPQNGADPARRRAAIEETVLERLT